MAITLRPGLDKTITTLIAKGDVEEYFHDPHS